MGAMQRRKGARGELEACEMLRRIFPEVRRRAMQSRGGHEGADLDNTPGLHIEVGIGGVNPRAKWEQAWADSGGDDTWPGAPMAVALTRRDHGQWLITIAAEDFMTIVELARNGAKA